MFPPIFGFWNLLLASVLLAVSRPEASELALFDRYEALELQLALPLKALKSQRGEDPKWLPATVRLKGEKKPEEGFAVKIKARGHFRRLKSSCPFPSYWLNFKKKQVRGSVFEGQDKIKVVAHCREGFRPYDDYIYKEYLVYRTYQILTEASFRVRLASIEYLDTKSGHVGKPHPAFFIEHVKAFEYRQSAKQYKKRYVEPSEYDERSLCRAEIFQYLVGNTDFTFFASEDECCHNGKAFRYESLGDALVAVPYDFDMAGLVNAPYAVPNSKLNIQSVTERVYRGTSVYDGVLEETLDLYREKEDEVMGLWEEFEPLSQGQRAKALAFLSSFFAIVDDSEAVREKIVSDMRKKESLDAYIEKKIQESDNLNEVTE